MGSVNDFTKGNIVKIILGFYFPMLATNMLQQVYNFADTAIVGNGLGDAALAAVGNMGSLNFLVIGFSVGLSVGFTVLIAQFFGAKNVQMLKRGLAATIELAVIIMMLLTVFSNAFLGKALILLKTDESIMADSLMYGHILFYGLFATISYNLSAAILRAFGNSKTPLKAIVISSIINIVLDCIFIFVLKTGVEGAAIATVFSQVVAATICIIKISQIEYARLTKEDFMAGPSLYMDMLKNGIPMAIMNSITAVGCMVLQYFVNINGVVYTAAYAVCSKYINLFMNPASTAGQAMSAYTSQNYGAKQYKRILGGLKVCLSICLVAYIALGSIMLLFAPALANVFLTSQESIDLVVSYLHITGVMIFTVDFLFVVRSGVQGMGYPLVPMLSGVAEMVLRVVVIVLLISSFGFRATAIAEVSAWVGALLMNTAAFITIMRRIMKGENNGKRIRKMGSDNRSKQRNWTSVSRVYGKAGV